MTQCQELLTHCQGVRLRGQKKTVRINGQPLDESYELSLLRRRSISEIFEEV